MKIFTAPSFAPVSFTCETPEELKVMLTLMSVNHTPIDILSSMTISEINDIIDNFMSRNEWNALAKSVGLFSDEAN